VRFVTDRAIDAEALAALPGVTDVASQMNGHATHVLAVDAADAAVPALYEWSGRTATSITDLSIHRSTLEDVFLNLTGHRLRD
jgi:hypothetical protein